MTTDLASSALERAVLATVADGIVTAAEGKALHVAVAGSPSHLTFAGQLTRALHARGRACRCLTPMPDSPAADLPAGPRRAPDSPTIAVIVGEAQAADDGEVCGLSIRITELPGEAAPSEASRTDESDLDSGPDSDIVVDYSDPHGPTIRQFSIPSAQPTKPPALLVEGAA